MLAGNLNINDGATRILSINGPGSVYGGVTSTGAASGVSSSGNGHLRPRLGRQRDPGGAVLADHDRLAPPALRALVVVGPLRFDAHQLDARTRAAFEDGVEQRVDDARGLRVRRRPPRSW